MKRWYFVLVGLALFLGLMLAAAGVADAKILWCAKDPVIRVPDGTIVYIDVAVPTGHEDDGAQLRIRAPEGSEMVDAGDGELALSISMEYGRDDVVIAKAKPNGRYPTLLCIRVGDHDEKCKRGGPGKTVKVKVKLDD